MIKKILNTLFKKKEILFLEDLNIKIVGDLKKVNSSLTLDGGSKTLYLKDSQGNSFEVFLPYHKITKKGFTKGRMHLNNYPIKVRSKEEAQLLGQLSNIIKKEPKNSMVRDIVNFVKSEKYIEISKNIEEQITSQKENNFDISITEKDNVSYKTIDNHQKAIDLFNKGELSKIYLTPLEFGGMEMPMNILYVPKSTQMQKKEFDNKVEELLMKGQKLGYSASPEYKGTSIIPSTLTINTSGESELKKIINIW
ncbi:hypothetical protein [Aquimarina longa]|uniref:hypothetical protein n=1 Tax=Aquimarina longa TaxID=1080221 RepID=UPI000B2C03F7|nr:hypothetical protein [Aquimarina longa]